MIQSNLPDSPYFYGPYGYNPYVYYDPFGFNPFESAAYVPRFNADGTIANAAGENGSRTASKDEGAATQNSNTEKSPIPLNEFGFPPSLINVSGGKNPINLAPYPYSSYPLIYDQFGGYPQPPYLPPFGALPPAAYPGFGATDTKADDASKVNSNKNAATETSTALTEATSAGDAAAAANQDDKSNGGFENADSAGQPTTVFYDRQNGVNQGAANNPANTPANNPAGVYGDNGIGSEANGDLDNGFGSAANRNNAFGLANNRANNGFASSSGSNNGFQQGASGFRQSASSGFQANGNANRRGSNGSSGTNASQSRASSSTELRTQGQTFSSNGSN